MKLSEAETVAVAEAVEANAAAVVAASAVAAAGPVHHEAVAIPLAVAATQREAHPVPTKGLVVVRRVVDPIGAVHFRRPKVDPQIALFRSPRRAAERMHRVNLLLGAPAET